MRCLLAVLFMVSLASCSPVVPPEQKTVELHTTQIITEHITTPDGEEVTKKEAHFLCSGEFIDSNGDILTARHCVERISKIEVQTFDHQTYVASIKNISETHDLALIHIDRMNTPHFSLAKTVTRGEKISILGSPLGITNVLSVGVISKIDGDTILLDCGVLPGNSGGPVFNSKGELIGVATAGYIVYMGTTHLNIAQSIEAVRFFLKTPAKKYIVKI